MENIQQSDRTGSCQSRTCVQTVWWPLRAARVCFACKPSDAADAGGDAASVLVTVQLMTSRRAVAWCSPAAARVKLYYRIKETISGSEPCHQQLRSVAVDFSTLSHLEAQAGNVEHSPRRTSPDISQFQLQRLRDVTSDKRSACNRLFFVTMFESKEPICLSFILQNDIVSQTDHNPNPNPNIIKPPTCSTKFFEN